MSQNEKNAILKFDKKQENVDYEMQKCTFTPSINMTNVESKVQQMISRSPNPFSVSKTTAKQPTTKHALNYN